MTMVMLPAASTLRVVCLSTVAFLQRWANQSGYAPWVGLDRFLLSDNVNGGKLDVAMNNSVWNVTSNSNLDTLALSHSTVDFASHGSTAGTFTTLNVENLSGNSTFIMRADVVGEGNGVNNKGIY